MMRFEEDELEYAGAFITPPNHLKPESCGHHSVSR